MRNIARINAEIQVLRRTFGEEAVIWSPLYDWVCILGVPLPSNLNKPRTNLLIIIPENYGHGEPLKDAFVDPDLMIRRNGQWVPIPHYFPEAMGFIAKQFHKQYGKNWRYLCLHQETWNPERDSLLGYVNQIYTYLSDPWAFEEAKR